MRVGDAIVFTDLVGLESPSLTFVARTHARRPLYTSAAGKTLLANVPDREMNRLLDLAGPEQAADVRQFLVELPEIRSRRLAFNRGVTLADAFAAATPFLALNGNLIAAISAAVDASEADRLDDIGEELKKAVATLGPKYGIKRAEQPSSSQRLLEDPTGLTAKPVVDYSTPVTRNGPALPGSVRRH